MTTSFDGEVEELFAEEAERAELNRLKAKLQGKPTVEIFELWITSNATLLATCSEPLKRLARLEKACMAEIIMRGFEPTEFGEALRNVFGDEGEGAHDD